MSSSFILRTGRAPLAATALAIACLLSTSDPLHGRQPGPRAVVPEPKADLGIVALGADVSHTFTIRNEGDAPLRLEVPKTPAGVTLAHYDAEIAAGGAGTVQLRFDTFALQWPEFEVSLGTNDPAAASLALHVKVLVREFVGATPGYARYNFVQWAPEGTITQVLWAEDGADFKLLEMKSPYPHIRVAQREARADERVPDQEGRQWAVDMTIAADAPVGTLEGNVEIVTDHPRQPRVWIPVSGFVRPMFAVTPPVLALGDVRAAPGRREARLHVKNFAEETVELTSVTSDVPGITAAITPIEAGRTFSLAVTISPDLAPGAFQGTLTIHTNSRKQTTVDVPVSGTVTAP